MKSELKQKQKMRNKKSRVQTININMKKDFCLNLD